MQLEWVLKVLAKFPDYILRSFSDVHRLRGKHISYSRVTAAQTYYALHVCDFPQFLCFKSDFNGASGWISLDSSECTACIGYMITSSLGVCMDYVIIWGAVLYGLRHQNEWGRGEALFQRRALN